VGGGFLSSSRSSGGGGSSSYRDNGENDCHDDNRAENDLPPFWLSPPEISMLRSAEENPLEYTLAETDDAVSYVRILLKMLDQVACNTTLTSGSSPSSLSPSHTTNTHNTSTTHRASCSEDERIVTLDTPVFSEDDAFDLYYRSTKQHKRLVVAHYCVTKVYEIIGVSLDSKSGIPSISELFHGKNDDLNNNNHDGEDEFPDGRLHTIHLEKDEWRPLLKILYNRSSDEYTKRGSALILAYILNAGCERNDELMSMRRASAAAGTTAAAHSKPDEDLLSLFSEEHKTTLSPSRTNGSYSHHHHNSSSSSSTVVEDTLHSLISWLTSRLQCSGTYASLGVVTPTLGVLMSTTKQARIAFVQSGGIGYISRHLRAKRQRPPPATQLQLELQHRRYTDINNSNTSSSSRSQNNNTPYLQPFSVPIPSKAIPSKVPSPARHRKAAAAVAATEKRTKSQAASFLTNGFRNLSLSASNSRSSSVSSNLNRSDHEIDITLDDILQSIPSTEDVEKNLDSMLSTASEVAAVALSTPAKHLASLAASTPRTPVTLASSASSSSVQQLYDLVFCLWCLSLDCSTDESVRDYFARDRAVPALSHLLTKVPREKVLRMTLACLRSLSILRGGDATNSSTSEQHQQQQQQQQPFVRDMIGCGILKSLEMVRQRRWNDADLEDDLGFLQKLLSDRTEELTQWSAYEAQIATGILRWDEMLHTHDFFRANATHMEGSGGDFAPLKRLVAILYSNTISGRLRSRGRADEISYVGIAEVGGWDEDDLRDDEVCESLAVCLFDIGEFARNYPNGKAVLGSRCGVGAKALVMQYVHHPREQVQEQALLCASKLLVRNWRSIGD